MKQENWVSVKDRLPENNDNVLIFSAGRSIGWFCVLTNTWMKGIAQIKGVTHWMPLPEPPQQETPC